jgi:hypothetical protein
MGCAEDSESGAIPRKIEFFLDAADIARDNDQNRLAVHLYCAAFEFSIEQGLAPGSRVLEGMQAAWIIACEQGDRSSAEAIFNELLPYHSPQQAQQALEKLQDLAIRQLEELGMHHEDVIDIAKTMVAESIDADLADSEDDGAPSLLESPSYANKHGRLDLAQLIDDARDISEQAQKRINASQADARLAPRQQQTAIQPSSTQLSQEGKSRLGRSWHSAPAAGQQALRYGSLTGYDDTLRTMQQFGFVDAGDGQFADFVAQTESFHGISGPILSDSFVFHGPDRKDVSLFARATAGEIGWPVIEMTVEMDAVGNGTIKVTGPIRRSLLASQRYAEAPNPCILLIENIDLLQKLFNGERQAFDQGMRNQGGCRPGGPAPMGQPGFMPGFIQRTVESEVMAHLNALRMQSDVFIIATCLDGGSSGPYRADGALRDIIGTYREIHVPMPNALERAEILHYFAYDHPSFKEVDYSHLAELADGVARNELVQAAHQAVEEAYRESLRTGRHQMVTLSEVLTQMLGYTNKDSSHRDQIESIIIDQFNAEISDDLANL